jgi:alkanesulfonate monooxygenase SsuD/methylene tetrahydromethanopterin reductase-like flavin-dependent oxidoreductase (luciferase family)
MRFALMIEPQQGLTYGQQVAIAKRAEANGFETLFRSDHYASFPGPAGMPTTDAWTVLGGLARETERIGLGVLVSPVTFRHPGTFVKVVTTVDEMSGGRIEVGVGAGWNEEEHRQTGLSYPEIAERFDLLEDQLTILHGLWEEPDGWSYDGHVVKVQDARFYPKPVAVPGRPVGTNGAPRPNILVGGSGAPRGLRLAVRWADEFNTSSQGPEKASETYAKLEAACVAGGRDPGSIVRSAMAGVLVGRTATEVKTREAAVLTAFGDEDGGEAWLDERRDRWIVGSGDDAREMVQRFAAAGVERIMLQDFIPWDLDHIDAMGEVLVGRV